LTEQRYVFCTAFEKFTGRCWRNRDLPFLELYFPRQNLSHLGRSSHYTHNCNAVFPRNQLQCFAPTPLKQLGNWATYAPASPSSAVQELSQSMQQTSFREYEGAPRSINIVRDRAPDVQRPRHSSESIPTQTRHITRIREIVSTSPEKVPQISNHQPAGLPRLRVVASSEPSPRSVSSPRATGTGLLMSPRSAFVPAPSSEQGNSSV
jgi:hypothetical protein